MLRCRDLAIFLLCVSPASALVYASCYHMLRALHPSANEYAIFASYGFLQFCIGYAAGFGTARLTMDHHRAPPEVGDDEDAPLLSRAGAGTAETPAA
jgi:hypothetical protein